MCRKLDLRPGEHVTEAGAGWGSLALHMADRFGVTVRAYNVSAEQAEYARERAKSRGLADRVEFVDEDFRAITGECDAFVSVGMLEHVGRAHYRELGRYRVGGVEIRRTGTRSFDRPLPAVADEQVDSASNFSGRLCAVATRDNGDLRA